MRLEEVLEALQGKPAAELAEIDKQIAAEKAVMPWVPNPGPQTDAYFSAADIALYGGSAGGGKSQLLIGLASQEHQRSIIFRRESSQTDGLIAEAKKIVADVARYNGQDLEFSWADGRSMKFAGMKEADDWRKHAGRERDFIGFDEAGEFLEEQVASVIGWLRGPQGQRCRMVLASNPPRTAEGVWMIEWFAPWLDPKYPKPAQPGELRWAVLHDGKTVWVNGPGKVTVGGVEYLPHSRTFIPARLSDNPDRNTPEYISKLQMTPEPLRSQLIRGDFLAGQQDQDWQLIPTAWAQAAQARWKPDGHKGTAMTALALDPAGGGADAAALAMRYGGWYAPVETKQGAETADGSAAAAWIILHRRDRCAVVVDVGGGYGGAVCLRLKDNDVPHIGFNGADGSTAHTRDGKLRFANKRSEAYWKFREELDPDQQGGSAIALPHDPELLGDLTALTWKVTPRGIQVESKVIVGPDGKITGGVIKKLDRSPNKGDAVVMALSEGVKAAVAQHVMAGMTSLQKERHGLGHGAMPRVVMGRGRRR